jgi:hypothetical protein
MSLSRLPIFLASIPSDFAHYNIVYYVDPAFSRMRLVYKYRVTLAHPHTPYTLPDAVRNHASTCVFSSAAVFFS